MRRSIVNTDRILLIRLARDTEGSPLVLAGSAARRQNVVDPGRHPAECESTSSLANSIKPVLFVINAPLPFESQRETSLKRSHREKI